ncbi:MAG: sigma-70 family RNA polymerase sigma factor [Sporichthyaceae bacterium]
MNALAERFDAERPRLRAVAVRMLGSATEADDAVQEAWLRLGRVDAAELDNLGAWLTTVVSRICLDALRARTARREEPLEERPEAGTAVGPEHEALLAESVGVALLVLLDTLAPAERLAFVLHDLFAVPFEEIAPIVGRNAAATRQLASRARRRVQSDPAAPAADRARQRALVDAFLDAARNGRFERLLEMLDPNVEFVPDEAATAMGGPGRVRGAEQVAGFYNGRAQNARTAFVDGLPGAVVVVDGAVKIALTFTILDGRIRAFDVVGDPDTLAAMEIERFD